MQMMIGGAVRIPAGEALQRTIQPQNHAIGGKKSGILKAKGVRLCRRTPFEEWCRLSDSN
jgi:hypothetical protein